jgi:hypothetical protein
MNGGPLVNLTDGGDGVSGMRHSKESRAAIGAHSRKRIVKDETRAKLRLINLGNQHCLGRKQSQETLAKMRKTRAATIEARGSIYPDDDARARMSAAQIRRFADPLTRLQHGNNLKGRHSPEALEKKSVTKKAQWADKEYRTDMMARMKAASSTPEVVARKSEIAKELWSNPGYRAKQHGPQMRSKISTR